MKTSSTIFAATSFAISVSAHGLLSSPPPRLPGAADKAACGVQASNQDKNGNIQGILQVATTQSDFNPAKCNVWLCKGWQFADDTANVQAYTTGQVVPMTFNIAAPHTGVANVSIVDTATNTMIGSPLKSYTDFASNQHTPDADNTNFQITIPDLGGKCTTAGECVIQHYWDARDINQTYESCVDFTVGGGGASGGGSASPAPASSASSSPPSSSAASTPASKTLKPTTMATQTSTSAAAASAASSYPSSAPSSGSGAAGKIALPSGTTADALETWIDQVVAAYYASD